MSQFAFTAGGPDEAHVKQRIAEGRQQFLGLELLCGEGALVPRSETELLGFTAIEKIKMATSAHVIDLCCGVGNLACAVATYVPHARVWATDLTDECVQWARKNVEKLSLDSRIQTVQGDLFQGLEGKGLEKTIDLIVCNPPYISTGRLATDRAPLLKDEPREAFDGGPYGLSIHQRVVAEAPRFLKSGGWLVMEFGLGQHRQVRRLLERSRAFDDITLVNDASGYPRVVAGRVKA
jgi:release factor glutamine methyltransferase